MHSIRVLLLVDKYFLESLLCAQRGKEEVFQDLKKEVNVQLQAIDSDSNLKKNLLAVIDRELAEVLNIVGWHYFIDNIITIQSILTIIQNSSDGDLPAKLTDFFAVREFFIEDTLLDYHCSDFLANRICVAVAGVLISSKKNSKEEANSDSDKMVSPYDLLLSVTKSNRKPWEKWLNPIIFSEALPKRRGEFFRANGKIHLYQPIVEGAIARLEQGFQYLAEIWLGTDPRGATPKKHRNELLPGSPLPLTQEDLTVLKNHSPAMAELVNYTVELNEHARHSKDYYKCFTDLREGLLQGDTSRDGLELEAGNSAYVAIVKFNNWFGKLPETEKDFCREQSIDNSSHSNSDSSIGEVLKIILDHGNAGRRDETVYCINHCSKEGKKSRQI